MEEKGKTLLNQKMAKELAPRQAGEKLCERVRDQGNPAGEESKERVEI